MFAIDATQHGKAVSDDSRLRSRKGGEGLLCGMENFSWFEYEMGSSSMRYGVFKMGFTVLVEGSVVADFLPCRTYLGWTGATETPLLVPSPQGSYWASTF